MLDSSPILFNQQWMALAEIKISNAVSEQFSTVDCSVKEDVP